MTVTNSKQSAIVIIFIILSALIMTIPASADVPAVYVDDDFDEGTEGWNITHFSDIQSGINNLEENGTLYIFNGSYYGDVYVNKSITITGANRDNVIVTGQFTVESSNVTIEQLTIRDFIGYGYDFPSAILDMSSNSTYRNLRFINNTYGIQLYDYSFNTVIDNNVFENNSDGIHTYYTSPHAVITNNIFTNNVENGIYIANSEYFTITNNYITNTAEVGLSLVSSSHNLIYNNYFGNSFNAYVFGGTDNSFNVSKTPGENIIGGMYLGGNYWSSYVGIDIDGDGLGEALYVIADGLAYDERPLVFTRLYVDDDADPSWYDGSHVHTIEEAIDNTSSLGAIIFVFNGTYNESVFVDRPVSIIGESIEGVYVTNDAGENTFFIDSPGVILANMTIADNPGGEGPTAAIYDSSESAIYTNLHLLNNNYGIRLSYDSSYTVIQNCVIENNSYTGIYMEFSNNALIHSNIFIDNFVGIIHSDAEQNIIYNNYFDNLVNVNIIVTESIYNTSWNIFKTLGENIIGGPYLGGNYWSDYTGLDLDSDGIGDTNHSLGNSSYNDLLPLTYINYPPVLGIPSPENGSSNQPLSLDWSIQINDSDGIFDWFISCSNGQSNHSIEDSNGTKTIELTDLSYGASYSVSVNVYDYYQWTNETFNFVTKDSPPSPPPKPKTNDPPVAVISGDTAGFPGESLHFYGIDSYDPDGTISSYSWTFGDGTSTNGDTVFHSYVDQGTYTVSLLVVDNKGKSDYTSTEVIIIKPNYPPELNLDADSSPGLSTVSLTVSVSDEDGDSVSCSIDWGDASSPTSFTGNNDQYIFSHTFAAYGIYTIFVTGNDGAAESSAATIVAISPVNDTNQSFEGFRKFVSNKEPFIDNQVDGRSIFGNFVGKEYAIPAATVVSISLLFLLNLLVEFLSDYSSEHVIDRRKDKKDKKTAKKTKDTELSSFLSKKELFAISVSSIVLALVLTWTWAPDLTFFWESFFIILVIVLVIIFLKEGLRSYLSYKNKFQSEYYVWPLGIGMMFVSTIIGNTFSLSANHHYDDKADIKKCGKVTFIVSIVLYAILVIVFLANLYYPSAILQMIVIVAVLNLFIDLFPFKPMDGYEIRHWNLFLWAALYVVVILSYIVVYFNLFP